MVNNFSCEGLTLIDTNVMLRYLLDDNEDMSLVAEQIIESGAWTGSEMLAEVTYVLEAVYNVPRKEIAAALNILANHIMLNPYEICIHAIKVYENSNLDFVDCIVVAYRDTGESKVFTFDKGINKYMRNPML